jgi:hypothetical protein
MVLAAAVFFRRAVAVIALLLAPCGEFPVVLLSCDDDVGVFGVLEK